MHLPFDAVVQSSGLALGTEKRTPAVPDTALLLVRSPPAVMVMAGWLGGGGAARAGSTVSPVLPYFSTRAITRVAVQRQLGRTAALRRLSLRSD